MKLGDREMPALASTMEERSSWMKSVLTTASSVYLLERHWHDIAVSRACGRLLTPTTSAVGCDVQAKSRCVKALRAMELQDAQDARLLMHQGQRNGRAKTEHKIEKHTPKDALHLALGCSLEDSHHVLVGRPLVSAHCQVHHRHI